METQKGPCCVVMKSLFGEDPPISFCPACGKQVIVYRDEMREVDPCPHLMFFYVNDLESYASEEFNKRKNQEETDLADYDDLVQFLHQLGYDDSMLVIEAVGSGLACGPVSISEFVGFNLITK